MAQSIQRFDIDNQQLSIAGNDLTISKGNTIILPTGNFFPLLGGSVTGVAGNGYIGLIVQSTNPATPSSGIRLFGNSTGLFSWKGADGFVRTLDRATLTADRTYTLPDVSGTIALTSNITNPIWGNITGTLASQTDLQNTLNLKATISGDTTFTGENILGGVGFTQNPRSGVASMLIGLTGGIPYMQTYSSQPLYINPLNNNTINLLGSATIVGSTTNTGEKFQVTGTSKFNGALNVTDQGQDAIKLDGVTVLGRFSGTNRIYGSGGSLQIMDNTGGTLIGQFSRNSFFANTYSAISSGTNSFVDVLAEANQSGTGGYTGIKLNVTETSVGSGVKNLLNLQVGGVSKFLVDRVGNVFANSGEFLANTITGVLYIQSPNMVYSPKIYAYDNTLIFGKYTGNVEFARFVSNGNFLIGTTTDTGEKLQVNGTSKFVGNVTITGQIDPPVSNTYSIGLTNYYASINSAIFKGSNIVMLGGGAGLNLKNSSSTQYAKMFESGGRWIFQDSGTFTDIPSARLAVNSTTEGFLPPRMTSTQASAISSPAQGLMLFVTDTNGTFTAIGWYGFNGSSWEKLNN